MKIVLHIQFDERHYYAVARHFRPADLPAVTNSVLFRRELSRLLNARRLPPTAEERILYTGLGPFFACPATDGLLSPDGSRLLIASDGACVSWIDFVSDPFPAVEVDGIPGVLRASKDEP